MARDATYGIWIRCDDALCAPEYHEHIIKSGTATDLNYTALMEVEPTDAAVWIKGFILTRT